VNNEKADISRNCPAGGREIERIDCGISRLPEQIIAESPAYLKLTDERIVHFESWAIQKIAGLHGVIEGPAREIRGVKKGTTTIFALRKKHRKDWGSHAVQMQLEGRSCEKIAILKHCDYSGLSWIGY
jgi:hypothetical protein